MTFIETAVSDARRAIRRLLKKPGFSAIVVVTLALGVGVNAAMFNVLRAVILKPLPHPHSEKLMVLEQGWPHQEGWTHLDWGTQVTWGTFESWRTQLRSFQELVAVHSLNLTLRSGPMAERVMGSAATANFFRTLGGVPALGRYFVDADDSPNAPRVAVLGYGLWQRDFGADRDVVGRELVLNDESYEVVGVAASDFRPDPFPATELWVPLGSAGRLVAGGMSLGAFGRLNPGVKEQTASAELSAVTQSVRNATAFYLRHTVGETARVMPMRQWENGTSPPKLFLLTGALILFLAIVCVNVTNLMLAWSLSRKGEWATRMALGASTWRVVRQVFAEESDPGGSWGSRGDDRRGNHCSNVGTRSGELLALWRELQVGPPHVGLRSGAGCNGRAVVRRPAGLGCHSRAQVQLALIGTRAWFLAHGASGGPVSRQHRGRALSDLGLLHRGISLEPL